MWGSRLRVEGVGFGIHGFGFRVQAGDKGFGFRVLGLEFRFQGLCFRVSGLGFRFSGFGFRVSGVVFWVVCFVVRGSWCDVWVSLHTWDNGDAHRELEHSRGHLGSVRKREDLADDARNRRAQRGRALAHSRHPVLPATKSSRCSRILSSLEA